MREDDFRHGVTVENRDGILYIIADDGIVSADGRLIVANDVYLTTATPYEWIVTRDGIREYYVLQSMEVHTEANTTVHAGGAPVIFADVRLEGSSVATVWALESIGGQLERSKLPRVVRSFTCGLASEPGAKFEVAEERLTAYQGPHQSQGYQTYAAFRPRLIPCF